MNKLTKLPASPLPQFTSHHSPAKSPQDPEREHLTNEATCCYNVVTLFKILRVKSWKQSD
jgi:hypothetical protein